MDLTLLKDRALMLKKVRSFFDSRSFTEVDCPALSFAASIDAHIDLFEVIFSPEKKGYLASSPEYGMKRLLAEKIGDIYQLSHVFRKGEKGALHNPEFTMIEWYRLEAAFTPFIEEVCELFALFLGDMPKEILSYSEAFFRFAYIDYKKDSTQKLIATGKEKGLYLKGEDREDLLNTLWGCLVEPHLGHEKLTVITDYPPEQAALAQVIKKGKEMVAERFEIYYRGTELGNGYHELRDPKEQKKRLEKELKKRNALGKPPLPIDYHFVKALEKGLPDCYGIAVGFDRLMMHRHGLKEIAPILPIPWEVV